MRAIMTRTEEVTLSEEPSETPAQPEVLTRASASEQSSLADTATRGDSGEGTLRHSTEGVAAAVAAGVAANLATPYVKAAIDGVVQKVKDHNVLRSSTYRRPKASHRARSNPPSGARACGGLTTFVRSWHTSPLPSAACTSTKLPASRAARAPARVRRRGTRSGGVHRVRSNDLSGVTRRHALHAVGCADDIV